MKPVYHPQKLQRFLSTWLKRGGRRPREHSTTRLAFRTKGGHLGVLSSVCYPTLCYWTGMPRRPPGVSGLVFDAPGTAGASASSVQLEPAETLSAPPFLRELGERSRSASPGHRHQLRRAALKRTHRPAAALHPTTDTSCSPNPAAHPPRRPVRRMTGGSLEDQGHLLKSETVELCSAPRHRPG